jgi:hypothetical protein
MPRATSLRSCVIASLFGLGACGGKPAATPDVPHIDFQSQTYTLQPGEEKYYCYTMRMPADRDVAIRRLVPTYGAGTHHILFSQAIATEPDGFSECNVLSRDTWLPLYAGGKNSGPLELPAGAALQLVSRGQQLIMQLHIQNATPAPISAVTSMRIETLDASTPFTPAGIFGYDDRSLTLPPHTTATTSSMSCVMDKHLDVFAVMGHMHRHGRHLQLGRGAGAAQSVLFDTDWNFDLQPVTPARFTVEPMDEIFLTCTHQNDGDTPIVYGESSDTEMCATVLYYTPFDKLGGCIKS